MARSIAHLTPRYIKNRLLVVYDEYRNPKNPWLTADSVRLLDQLIKPTDVGVEFGSGRSTIWFARRMAQLTSVEHNKEWYEKVRRMIAENDLDRKIDYRKAEGEEAYLGQIDTFEDSSIDVCLVDGIYRDKCALAMVPKLKPGALLIVDNINWFIPSEFSISPNTRRNTEGCASQEWHLLQETIESWRNIWTTNGVWDTAVFIKIYIENESHM